MKKTFLIQDSILFNSTKRFVKAVSFILFLLSIGYAQVKVYSDRNTSVGTLNQFSSITKLQTAAGASGNADPRGLAINCLNHTNNYAYCQINNVNKPLSKAFEVQLYGATKMYIKGDGGIVNLSDSTLKTNITAIDSALNKVLLLDGVTFYFADDTLTTTGQTLRAGFLAQNMEQAISHLVETDDNSLKGINNIELIPYLVEAIKELNAKIEALTPLKGTDKK